MPPPKGRSNLPIYFAERMAVELPPPDPNESLGMQPDRDAVLSAPTAVFAMGRPSAQVARVADAVLDLRPGLLIVVESD
jgi:hypothetical protein